MLRGWLIAFPRLLPFGLFAILAAITVMGVAETVRGGVSGLRLAMLAFSLLVDGMLAFAVHLLACQAITDDARLAWLEQQASIRNLLTRELNHRVKNTLANVLSIIALTRRRTFDIDEFVASLDGRIRALSATHELLTQSEWGPTQLRAVIEAELLPYALGADHVVVIEGDDVELAPGDALSLGLAIHELATNAAKYGALSLPDGAVSVRWTALPPGLVQVEWEERGGPPVPQLRERGFGLDLIERVVADELSHPVLLEFDPAGVRCVLTISLRTPRQFALRAEPN